MSRGAVADPSRVERTERFGVAERDTRSHHLVFALFGARFLDEGGHGEQEQVWKRSCERLTQVKVCENGRKATAAVMRYGYRRGEFFEGCETRCGEGRRRSPGKELRLRWQGRSPRNTANPLWYQVAIHREPSERSKPSRW